LNSHRFFCERRRPYFARDAIHKFHNLSYATIGCGGFAGSDLILQRQAWRFPHYAWVAVDLSQMLGIFATVEQPCRLTGRFMGLTVSAALLGNCHGEHTVSNAPVRIVVLVHENENILRRD
jgi:hypothetical protein